MFYSNEAAHNKAKREEIQEEMLSRNREGSGVYFADLRADLRGFCQGPEMREGSILACLDAACHPLIFLLQPRHKRFRIL